MLDHSPFILRPWRVLRSAFLALGLAIAVLGAVGALMGPPAGAEAPDPKPGPSTPVREQNVDDSGAIRVHETGVAAVEVTNSALQVEGSISVENFPSSFEVSNLPSVQDVEVVGDGLSNVRLAPVTTVVPTAFFSMEAQTSQTQNFAPMHATTILISDFASNEFTVRLHSPLSNTSLTYSDNGGHSDFAQLTFDHPLPVDGIGVDCENEFDNCTVLVDVVGF